MRALKASLVRSVIIAASLVLAAGASAWAKPEASGARAGLQDGGVTRFVLDLSEQIDLRVTSHVAPNRIVIETPDLDWRSQGLAKPLGPFKDVRFARQGGKAQILIDLSEPVAIRNAYLIPPRQGFGWRMVVDVAPSTVAAVRSAKPVDIGSPRFDQPAERTASVAPKAAVPQGVPNIVSMPAPKPVVEAKPVPAVAQAPRPMEIAPPATVIKPAGPTGAAVQTSSFVITSPTAAAPQSAPAPAPAVVAEETRSPLAPLSPVSSAMAAPVVPVAVVTPQPVPSRATDGVRSVSMPLPPPMRTDRVQSESRPTPVAVTPPAPTPAPAAKAAEPKLAALTLPSNPEPKIRDNAESKKGSNKKHDDTKVIVIDPGHGGVDPGALSVSGVFEKNITLGVALAVKAEIERKGRYRVVLTRDRDIFIPLRDRVKIARQAGADLFISMHADSVGNPGIRGLSVYTLSETASDAEAAALADKENKVDLIAGLDLTHESPEVTNILIDLTQRETLNRSASAAQLIVGELGEVTTLLGNSHRFAGFAVLKAPDVPSVLIELGYLSNKDEEPLLRQAAYRAKLAAALSRSIERYFANPVKGKRS